MRKKRSPKPLALPPLHPRYDSSKPLLRELVSVEVTTSRNEHRSILLTRVPSLGEEIAIEADTYRVTRVLHVTVDDDGRAFAGSHAYIDAELQLEPEEPRKLKKPKT